MDVLIVEPLDPKCCSGWARATRALRRPNWRVTRGAFGRRCTRCARWSFRPRWRWTASTLQAAPMLRAVGRLSAGAENIDLEACARAPVSRWCARPRQRQAEAEFVVGALLQMLRRVPVVNAEGLLVGRELGGCTVGLVGMTPAAAAAGALLSAFGAKVVGYDPGVHASDGLWTRWGVEPVSLRELIERCDGVCVLLSYFTRYRACSASASWRRASPTRCW
jgi:D-3-phosphoglycerate dehydrogenase / 2-oxoglutarate reductase